MFHFGCTILRAVRVACAAALLAIALGLIPAATSQALPSTDLVVIGDALGPGWDDNWSWNTAHVFQTATVYAGSAAVAVSYDQGWAGYSIHHDPIGGSLYTALDLYIHGGAGGGQQIQVMLEDPNNQVIAPAVPLDGYIDGGGVMANTWRHARVPLSDLNPAGVTWTRIDLQDASGHAQPTLYLDEMRLIGATPPVGVNLSIDPSNVLGAVPQTMFGTNAAFWDGNIQANANVVAEVRASGVMVIRFPGGSSSDSYHWRDYEPGTPGNAWSMNTTEFISFTHAVNAQPMITVNFSGTLQEAADWVRFTNVTHTWGVRLWEIGNEIYGDWENSWTHDGALYCNGDGAHPGFNAFYDAMKAVDPSILIGAVGALNATEYDSWGLKVLQNCGSRMDFYVIHRYPVGPGNRDYVGLLADPQVAWPAITQDIQTMMSASVPTRSIPIALTEYNSYWTEPEPLAVEVVNLLYLADTLGQAISQRFTFANHWDILNGLTANGGDYGYLMDPDAFRQPSYYAFPLWRHFGDQQLATALDHDPATVVSAYAGRDSSTGDFSVLAINKTGLAQPMTITLQGDVLPLPTADACVVAGRSLDSTSISYNGNTSPPIDLSTVPPIPVPVPANPFSVTLPAYSVTSLILHCHVTDIDCNGGVTASDLTLCAQGWHTRRGDGRYLARCDLDRNGYVDATDLAQIGQAWGWRRP
jgi:alpha-N-arabinofuranosidase